MPGRPSRTLRRARGVVESPRVTGRVLLGVVVGIMAGLPGCDTGWEAGSPLLRLCDSEPEAVAPRYVLDEPEATIDGNRTDPPLSPPIIFPTLAPGGGISLAMAYQAPVLTFDVSGAQVMSAGGRGTGPGEWPAAMSGGVTWLADTLMVVESRPPRIHRFRADGSLIDSRRVPPGPETVSVLLGRMLKGAGTTGTGSCATHTLCVRVPRVKAGR